jgi:hypothetical protein
MTSLQRAVLMLRKLSLHGIPWDIRDALRQLQDAYSEELDLSSLDSSSQGSIEHGEREETDFEEGREKGYKDKRGEIRAKSQQGGAEQRSTRGNIEQGDEEHEVNKEEGRKSNLEEKDHSEANLEIAFSQPSFSRHDIDSILRSGNSSSQFWRWGPSATCNDAANFFRRVVWKQFKFNHNERKARPPKTCR